MNPILPQTQASSTISSIWPRDGLIDQSTRGGGETMAGATLGLTAASCGATSAFGKAIGGSAERESVNFQIVEEMVTTCEGGSASEEADEYETCGTAHGQVTSGGVSIFTRTTTHIA
jgi:hypothetical protein